MINDLLQEALDQFKEDRFSEDMREAWLREFVYGYVEKPEDGERLSEEDAL
jgi:hypothetical protein